MLVQVTMTIPQWLKDEAESKGFANEDGKIVSLYSKLREAKQKVNAELDSGVTL